MKGKHYRWRRGDMDAMSWVILLAGVVSILFYVLLMLWLTPVYGATEECDEYEATGCTDTVWVLSVGWDDVAEFATEEECVEAAGELDEQAPPFTAVYCRKETVARQET